MSALTGNSHILYREVYHKDQQQQFWGGGSCLLLQKTCGLFWVDIRKRNHKRSSIKRDMKVEAFWPDLSRPVAVEMEPIKDCDQLDQILLHAQELSQPILIDWMASWCRKCIYLKPRLEKLAAEYDTKLKFYYVDVNKVPQALVKRGNISVEAYRPNDSACHGRFGITARTAPVFGPGGHAYVYLCYGLHTMLNIVADKEGVGAAVLIRSCAPVGGLETIQQRRGQKTIKPMLLTGPGKVGQALGISTEWSHHPLYTPGGLELLDGPEPEKILIGPRVGIEYALPEHVNALWRFAIAGTPWISAPKSTLRPP